MRKNSPLNEGAEMGKIADDDEMTMNDVDDVYYEKFKKNGHILLESGRTVRLGELVVPTDEAYANSKKVCRTSLVTALYRALFPLRSESLITHALLKQC